MKPLGDGLEVAPADIAGGRFLSKEAQALLHERLSKPLVRLFAELTGLPLHVWWHPRRESHFPDAPVVLCPTARRALSVGTRPLLACQACLQSRWHCFALEASDGRRFLGRCAATNLSSSLRANGLRVLSLVLHARISSEYPESRKPSPPGRPGQVAVRGGGLRECQVSAEAFDRAESLLRLILHDLQATLQAHQADRERSAAPHRSKPPVAADAHRQNEPAEGLPAVSPTASSIPLPGRRSWRIVEAMLDYVRLHYQRPMALKELAAALGMNANYLSGLFRHSMGTTFHRYLDGLRMAKAEELLGNPRTPIHDVAKAVGYASPNHFRSVFKVRTGLSPTAWTEASITRPCSISTGN